MSASITSYTWCNVHPTLEPNLGPLKRRLRRELYKWRQASLKAAEYKCMFTGDTENLEVHHLYPFSMVVREAVMELIKEGELDEGWVLHTHEFVGPYPKYDVIRDRFFLIHNQHGLGAVLNRRFHEAFHRQYQQLEMSPQLFYQFYLEMK